MSGFDLREGKFNIEVVAEDEFWKSFKLVFSTKTANSSSYKYVFLKSIIDCLDKTEPSLKLSFEQVFTRFTEIYWILVVKYGMKQGISSVKETYIEQILHEYVDICIGQVNISYNDLTDNVKIRLVQKVKKECKRYVVGALYGDTKGLFYSFSKKEEWIAINPLMYKFIKEHRHSIEELNYYELAKFIERVNETNLGIALRENLQIDYNKDDITTYRYILHKEFEDQNCSESNDYEINTLDLLLEAESFYDKISHKEKENQITMSALEQYDFERSDTESMMVYLDDPERIIKMLKLRNGIILSN